MMKNWIDRAVLLWTSWILVAYALFYWSYYAGDSVIHLIYGQNAAMGHWFEFNLGEKSSGETSTGYMLMIAGLFRLFSAEFVPIAVKLLNYLGWFLLLFTFFRLLTYKKFNKYMTATAMLVAGLLPGSVYNSLIGMENVLFGFFALLWYFYAQKCAYFCLDTQVNRQIIYYEIIFGFSLGACTWLRPEAAPFFMVALATRLVASLFVSQSFFPMLSRSGIGFLSFSIPVIWLIFFNHMGNGTWIPSSVQTRAMLYRAGYPIGPFIVDLKALLRMAIYFPVTLFWLRGAWTFFKKDWSTKIDEIFALVVFATFIFLFTFVVGAGHLGRYMIFLIPFWVLIAARGLESIMFVYGATYPKIVVAILAASAFILSAIYCGETYFRSRLGGNGYLLEVINAPKNIKKQSDILYHALKNPVTPVVIAYGEVQARYWLDNRFIVRSLDGRTDSAMLKYIHKNYYDYAAYIKERNIAYFVADYAADLPTKEHFSKAELLRMRPGQFFESDGLQFTCIDRLLLGIREKA